MPDCPDGPKSRPPGSNRAGTAAGERMRGLCPSRRREPRPLLFLSRSKERRISQSKRVRRNQEITTSAGSRHRRERRAGRHHVHSGRVANRESSSLDLVEVAPNAEPPVCRIMDYGKFVFEQNKKAQSARRKQKQTQIKEVKFRPGTEEGDYQVKLRNLVRFLTHGDKTKVTLRFRGREMAHQELGSPAAAPRPEGPRGTRSRRAASAARRAADGHGDCAAQAIATAPPDS